MQDIPSPSQTLVPLERVSKFVRQLTHDVRNGLSAIDLETAFIAEISTEEEVLAEIRKLREMVAETAKMLRQVSQFFQPVTVHPISWPAATVMEEVQKRLIADFPEEASMAKVENRFSEETVEIDLNQTLTAVMAVVRNAVQFRQDGMAMTISGMVQNGEAVIELREPKPHIENETPPEEWGLEPLRTTRSGGYGLGLYQARQIAAAQGGSLQVAFDKNELVTQIKLPMEAK